MLERETNCGNQVAKIAGEWGERKIGGKKKELGQQSCWKLREKFNSNLGNEVAENEGKKNKIYAETWRKKNCGNWFVAMELPKWEEKK